jgi:hypothetical protein
MPTLKVSNGLIHPLDGLANRQTFSELSEKRVTRCTRDALRRKYGSGCPRVLLGEFRWSGLERGVLDRRREIQLHHFHRMRLMPTDGSSSR